MTKASTTTITLPGVDGAPVEVRVSGIAKGVGMIEPDMATLLAFFLTDADVEADVLDTTFRRVIDRSLNAVSIDTDTSTSDTAAILASGQGPALYKEWKLSGPAAATGVFEPGGGPRQVLTLILQGRGNSCTDASDFSHWTLVMQGPKANYTLFGDLVTTR